MGERRQWTERIDWQEMMKVKDSWINRRFPLVQIVKDDSVVHLRNRRFIHWTTENSTYLLHLFVSVPLLQQGEVNRKILKIGMSFFSHQIKTDPPWPIFGLVSIIIDVLVVRVSLSESPSIFDSSACISLTSDLASSQKKNNHSDSQWHQWNSYSIHAFFSDHQLLF